MTATVPAQAAVPASVVGTGATKVATLPGFALFTRNVTVATVTRVGTLTVSGKGTKPVTCVTSFHKSGVKIVLMATAETGGRFFLFGLSEGAGADKPWAFVRDEPGPKPGTGLCGSGFGSSAIGVDAPAAFQVPANRFIVVGG